MADFIAKIKDAVCNTYELICFPAKDKSKFAVICPGGGYKFVSTAYEGIPVARALNKEGITAFVLRYRTKKKGRYPIAQNDLANAVRHIIDNADSYNVETAGYSVWGFSAGGHLAASFGTDNMGYKNYGLPAPAALILSYPVITMGRYGHNASFYNLLGKNSGKEDFGSIEKNITPDYPPTYVWCCEHDNCVPDENTRLMERALGENNVKHNARIFGGVKKGHGIALGIGTAAEPWFKEALNFWRSVNV